MTNTNVNPFDFSDLSDLPEDLQKKLHTETADHARAFADVVQKGADAGVTELDINQIMAAALRMGVEVPTQQTVRNYLNKAVELGYINKPSRQTYGAPASAAAVADTAAAPTPSKGKAKAEAAGTADPVVTADAAPSEDPLAGLGM